MTKIIWKKKKVKFPRISRELDRRCKLTTQDIKEVRFYKKSGMKLQEIADIFKVSFPTILYHTSQEYNKKVREHNRKHIHPFNNKVRRELNHLKGDALREYFAVYKREIFLKNKCKTTKK